MMCSLALELETGGRTSILHASHSFLNSHLILRCPGQQVSSPNYPRDLPLHLFLCLLFVVILLRKIAHPFGLSDFESRLYGKICYASALKGISAGLTLTMRAVSNELRPNT